MAKTNWTMGETVQPADMNQIGQEINTNTTAIQAATSAATANTLVQRDASGRFKAAAPSAADDVARKAEIDSVVSDGVKKFIMLSDGTDLNTVVTSGFYRLLSIHTNMPAGVANGQMIVSRGADTIVQLAFSYNGHAFYMRQGYPPEVGGAGSWGPWVQMIHSGGGQTINGGLILNGALESDGNMSVKGQSVINQFMNPAGSINWHNPAGQMILSGDNNGGIYTENNTLDDGNGNMSIGGPYLIAASTTSDFNIRPAAGRNIGFTNNAANQWLLRVDESTYAVSTLNNILDNGSGLASFVQVQVGNTTAPIIEMYEWDSDKKYYIVADGGSFSIRENSTGSNSSLLISPGFVVRTNNNILDNGSGVASFHDMKITAPTDQNTGWAHGMRFTDRPGSTTYGSVGMFGTSSGGSTTINSIYIGHGATPYEGGSAGIIIEPTGKVVTKNNVLDSGAGNMSIAGKIRLVAGSDPNHALGFYDSFDGVAVAGPVLHGYDGGALGSYREGEATRYALLWRFDGRVNTKNNVLDDGNGNMYVNGLIKPTTAGGTIGFTNYAGNHWGLRVQDGGVPSTHTANNVLDDGAGNTSIAGHITLTGGGGAINFGSGGQMGDDTNATFIKVNGDQFNIINEANTAYILRASPTSFQWNGLDVINSGGGQTIGGSLTINSDLGIGGHLFPNTTTGTIASNAAGVNNLEVRSAAGGGDAAFMTFHRQGSHAVHFGLDTDNQLKVGGWSVGGNAYQIWHAGNQGNSDSLLTSSKSVVGAINELFTSASNGKSAVATAITGMGQAASGSDTYAQLASKISAISTDANATTGQVLSGQTFYSSGLKTGTMPNRGAPTLTAGQSIPSGYYSGGSVAESQYSGIATPSGGMISVSGLPFTPSYVYINQAYSSGDFYQEQYTGFPGGILLRVRTTINSTNNTASAFMDSTPFVVVTGNSFTCRVSQTTSVNYTVYR
ncbi:pyocin knob domain-containing protein [Paenibacillus hemerocallicola]|uniref:pyocin knob domain-containing protein n=1 Tax=Paenibacillus hemerocallicola TaxID=1172614 RepID=UPI001C401840|nr:pyocin knob domain-containing protein [Paenibacillus hemerocallicola]